MIFNWLDVDTRTDFEQHAEKSHSYVPNVNKIGGGTVSPLWLVSPGIRNSLYANVFKLLTIFCSWAGFFCCIRRQTVAISMNSNNNNAISSIRRSKVNLLFLPNSRSCQAKDSLSIHVCFSNSTIAWCFFHDF